MSLCFIGGRDPTPFLLEESIEKMINNDADNNTYTATNLFLLILSKVRKKLFH